MSAQRNLKLILMLLVVPILCSSFASDAQKTAQRWYSSSSSSSSQGSRPQAVYGGYRTSVEESQQQEVPLAPVQQQRTQSFKSSSFSRKVNRPQPLPIYQQQESSSYESSVQSAEASAEPASFGSVDGQAGSDYPSYTRVPKTSFTCRGVPYDYGMYADEETGCQAYHLCYNGRKDSFLCGPGTVFNQQILHCDYWYNVDCSKARSFYGSNAYMGSSNPEPRPVQAGEFPPQVQQISSSSSYSRAVNRPPPPSPLVSSGSRQSSSFIRESQQVQESY